MTACVWVCVRACVCVHCSLSHPNTSRLITRRESQSGSRRIQFLLSSAKNKGRSFPPFPLHLLLLISLSLFFFSSSSILSPHPSSPAHLLAAFHGHIHSSLVSGCAHTHTPSASQPPYCGKRGVNVESLRAPVRGDQ